jgi:hypothetical protein
MIEVNGVYIEPSDINSMAFMDGYEPLQMHITLKNSNMVTSVPVKDKSEYLSLAETVMKHIKEADTKAKDSDIQDEPKAGYIEGFKDGVEYALKMSVSK